MRILITNDDGITAPGLAAAEALAAEVAGPGGEVWVVAPALEQSAISHAVAYVRPMRLERHGDRRFAVEGSPADCVLVALNDLMEGRAPDLVLSGVNRGHNVAEDVIYSGTVAGAMEAAMHGLKAVALSQYFGPGNLALDDVFDAARTRGAGVVRALLDHGTWHDHAYGVFYNVNFPPCAAAAVKGVKATFQGHRPDPSFRVEPYTAPNRREYYWLTHNVRGPASGNAGAEPGSDARETLDGFVTVSPLRARLTADDVLPELAGALDAL